MEKWSVKVAGELEMQPSAPRLRDFVRRSAGGVGFSAETGSRAKIRGRNVGLEYEQALFATFTAPGESDGWRLAFHCACGSLLFGVRLSPDGSLLEFEISPHMLTRAASGRAEQ